MLDKNYILNNEDTLRESICQEALTFLNTPYHVLGMLKGAGVDCMTLLILIYSNVGLIDIFKPQSYSPDFLFHKNEEDYLNGVSKFGKLTTEYKKGNIILYKFGRCVSHSAVIINEIEGTIVHAISGQGVILENYNEANLKKHEHSIYSLWEN